MTKRQIIAQLRALKPRTKEYLHSVPDQAGLYLCVRPDGAKLFALRFTSPVTKKRRLMMLDANDLDAVKANDALDLLEDVIAEVIALRKNIKAGIDPLDVAKREQDEAIRNHRQQTADDQLTVEAMCEWYVGSLYGGLTKEQRDSGKVSPSAKRSARTVEQAFEANVYPVIGDLRANTVTVKDCANVRSSINKRGAKSQANRVMAYLTAAFNFVIGIDGVADDDSDIEDYLDLVPDFQLQLNPAAQVKRYDETRKRRAGERTLSNREIRRLWKEVGGDCMSDQLAVALRFLLSTGQRVEEVLEATWGEFTLDKDSGTGEWAIPMERRKAKAKARHLEPHIVPLEQIHLELLAKAKAMSGRSKYVFPNRDKAPRSSNSLNQAVRRYCKPQGISKRRPFELFSPRDCRRSFKTLGSTAGAVDAMLDRLQGHNVSDLSASHYNRYDKLLEKRQAMKTFTWALDVVINVKATDDAEELRQLILERFPPDNVVMLEAAS